MRSAPGRLARRVVRGLYLRLRLVLPITGAVLYSGYPGPRDRRLGDSVLARRVPELWSEIADRPDYEPALLAGLSREVRSGDRVTVIGGGFGITAVHAAKLAGATGKVICYEAATERLPDIMVTARRNGVAHLVEAHSVIVGDPVDVHGIALAATIMRPEHLPDCDVLELDCEGSERSIFAAMTIRPRAIIVETHGMFGAPTASVKSQLEGLGYSVTDLGVAEPRLNDICIVNDIRVLVGTRA